MQNIPEMQIPEDRPTKFTPLIQGQRVEAVGDEDELLPYLVAVKIGILQGGLRTREGVDRALQGLTPFMNPFGEHGPELERTLGKILAMRQELPEENADMQS